jgi:hypothetical protein
LLTRQRATARLTVDQRGDLAPSGHRTVRNTLGRPPCRVAVYGIRECGIVGATFAETPRKIMPSAMRSIMSWSLGMTCAAPDESVGPPFNPKPF